MARLQTETDSNALSVCVSVCLSVCLSVSICLSVCVYLSVFVVLFPLSTPRFGGGVEGFLFQSILPYQTIQ